MIDSTKLRLDLKAQGYHPIPVTSPHPNPKTKDDEKLGKIPLMEEWQTCFNVDEATIKSWKIIRPRDGNTGVLCGELVGVDIDVPEAFLAFEIGTIADEMLGLTPLRRVGQAPKTLRCYRIDGAPLPKDMTPPMVLPDGTKLQVELLGQGQQFVAFGIHPGTRKDYTWVDLTPLEIPFADLPLVTEAQLLAFKDKAEAIFREAGAVPVKTKKQADKEQPDDTTGQKGMGKQTSGSARGRQLVAIVTHFKGDPTKYEGTKVRWGNHGSLCVDTVEGRWWDFEGKESGDDVDFVAREKHG